MSDIQHLTQEQWALMVLSLTEGLSPATARAMIEELGSADAIVSASGATLTNNPKIRPKLARLLLEGNGKKRAEEELKKLTELAKNGSPINLVFAGSNEYPTYLDNCPDAPLLLYVRGKLPTTPMVSIVGTRKNTHYSLDLLNYLMKGFATLYPNLTIVSGLAYGVDKLAHQLALENGLRSVGVVAHGHYTLYPSAHRRLADEMIAKGGGIVSEYPYDTRALPQRFVQRNRIVAGLSQATIVIESGARGGSLITASIAFGYDRAIFAAPGRVFDATSTGCNNLIEMQKASIVTSPERILRDIGLISEEPKQLPLPFGEEEPEETDDILKALRKVDELTLEDLVAQMGEGVAEITSRLFDLEMEGKIRALPGGRYTLKRY